MNVYFNLAAPRDRREQYSMAWSIPVLVLSLIALAWMAATLDHDLRHSHQIQRSLAEIRTQDAAVRARETHLQTQVDRPEFKQLVQKTKFVNQLIYQKQFSLTELTLKISKLLPPSARLNNLALASSAEPNPEVQFAVMGKSEKAIETFLDNLEDSNDFSDVIIKSQGFRAGSGNGPQQVALICTAKYVAGVSPSGN